MRAGLGKCLLPKAFFKCQKLITHRERRQKRKQKCWGRGLTRRMSDLARGLPLGKQLIQNHGHNLCKLLYRQDGSAGQKALTKCCHVYAWATLAPVSSPCVCSWGRFSNRSLSNRPLLLFRSYLRRTEFSSACTPAEYPNKYCHSQPKFGMFHRS